MSRARYYVLDPDGQPRPEPDVLRWALWFEQSDLTRVVARDEVGAACVSTVFLGLDHNFSMRGPPLLWETCVFRGELATEGRRSATRDDALRAHAAFLARVIAVEGAK